MTTDATQVTGSPLAGHEVARRGDVLAERYELLEVLDADGPSIGYRAVDQETERSVLVRVLAGPGLPERTLGEVVERLRALVGVGGRYLSSLLDADREGKRPFTVEAWPAGTPLSAIFASRRTREEPLGAREVLPLVARIAAGLAAIPEPWHHGDVRAERVWVDTDGVRLTGAFLLAALPPPALRERIEELGPGALAYAPEVAAGRLGASADRWGLAAIAWEALTGRAPELASHPPELSTPLRAALLRLLDPEPGRRAKDVSALLDALAHDAGLDAPEIDPEPHRPPGDVGRPPRSVPPPVRRRIEGAAEEGTQEITFDQILAGRAIESDDDALDPDLVAAALADDTARQAPVSHETSAPDLDPRLVRAALGVTSEESSLEEGLPLPPAGGGRGEGAVTTGPTDTPPPRPSPSGRAQNGLARGLPLPPAGGGRGEGAATTGPTDTPPPRPSPSGRAQNGLARGLPLPPAGGGRGEGAATTGPTDTPPPSPARRRSQNGLEQGLPLPPAGGGRGEGAATTGPTDTPPPSPASRGGSSGRGAATGRDGATAIVPRPVEEPAPPPARRSRLAGPLIVLTALLLAVAIVGLGFFIRAQMTEKERAREIQERLEQIRSADPGA